MASVDLWGSKGIPFQFQPFRVDSAGDVKEQQNSPPPDTRYKAVPVQVPYLYEYNSFDDE